MRGALVLFVSEQRTHYGQSDGGLARQFLLRIHAVHDEFFLQFLSPLLTIVWCTLVADQLCGSWWGPSLNFQVAVQNVKTYDTCPSPSRAANRTSVIL